MDRRRARSLLGKQYHQFHFDSCLSTRTGFNYPMNASQASPQVKVLERTVGYHILIRRRIRVLNLDQLFFSDRKPESSLNWVCYMFLELISLFSPHREVVLMPNTFEGCSHSYSYLAL